MADGLPTTANRYERDDFTMPKTLSEQAHQAAIDAVKAEKPSSFTVGGRYDGKRISGGLTYDRKLSNGYGLTAYARAWWEDATVSTHTPKPKIEAGAELTKKF
ncbi:MAG: hypothetical protein RLY20_1883 [Verrucomicrobiota bacterium]|jgi:hypothetical protein